MGMIDVFAGALFAVMLLVLIMPGVGAQSGEVCLVYFTSSSCGSECVLTDSFIEGLSNEYSGVLMTIIYYVDANQDNKNVFEAYRANYGLPPELPIVLFAPRDYLQGKDNIFGGTEAKVVNFIEQNGSNCPLDSGYIPPGSLDPGGLPGSPQVVQIQPDGQEEVEYLEDFAEDDDEPESFPRNLDSPPPLIEMGDEDFEIPIWIIVASIFTVIVIAILVMVIRAQRNW